jgi:hypothetical protein
VLSFAIITTRPNGLRRVARPDAGHSRSASLAGGLGEQPANPAPLKAMLEPYPSDEMTCWPLNSLGKFKNNDPALIEANRSSGVEAPMTANSEGCAG